MSSIWLFSLLAFTLFVTACDKFKAEGYEKTESVMIDNVDLKTAADSAVQFTPPPPRQEEPISAPALDWNKKIMKTANLSIQVKEAKRYSKTLQQAVTAAGGYISTEEQTNTEYHIQNNVTIKVPVATFDKTINDITKEATSVTERKITAEDVTVAYVDAKGRMEAKRQVRQRYLDLLQKAKNVDDMLAVQRELGDVQEELETAAGRASYLAHASAMSTIHLTYEQLIDNAVPKYEEGFYAQVKRAFATGFEVMRTLIIAVVSIWPLLLLLPVAIWLFKKKAKPMLK